MPEPKPEPKPRPIEPYDPCHCGSGRKYKFCCMKVDRMKTNDFLKHLFSIFPDTGPAPEKD